MFREFLSKVRANPHKARKNVSCKFTVYMYKFLIGKQLAIWTYKLLNSWGNDIYKDYIVLELY